VDYWLLGTCVCDFDDDKEVNMLDIAVLVDNWLLQGPGNIADVSGDELVNFADFAVCAARWHTPCADGRLVFNPGETSKTIGIDIVDDGLDEEDETIEVTLSNPTGADVQLGAITEHTYTIVDTRPKVSFDTEASSASEDAGPAIIGVSLSHAGSRIITVDYAVTGGTATGGGVDYTLAAGTLTFDPGVTADDVVVAIVDDGLVETNETIEVTLSNPSNATLGANTSRDRAVLAPRSPVMPPPAGRLPAKSLVAQAIRSRIH